MINRIDCLTADLRTLPIVDAKKATCESMVKIQANDFPAGRLMYESSATWRANEARLGELFANVAREIIAAELMQLRAHLEAAR